MTHELKTWTAFFKCLQDGSKTFEIRKNDRDYKVGDRLWCREYNPETHSYLGPDISFEVTYVMKDHDGLRPGYVIMGIIRV
jgi:hypothetical protein